jgi:MFS family permease
MLAVGFGDFTPQAKYMVFASVLEGIGASFVWFLYALYLEEQMFTPGTIGIILMIMGLSQTVPLLPAGYLGDRFGRKRMVFIGIVVNAFGIIVVIQADTFLTLCAGSTLWGLGQAFYRPSFMALMSEKVDEKKRKYLFSLQAFASMVSGACALLVAGYLPGIFAELMDTALINGYRATFWLGTVILIGQVVMLVPVTETEKYGTGLDKGEQGVDEGACPPIPWGTLFLLCLPMILLGLGAGLIVPFFQLYFVWRFDTPVHIIGILFAITHFFWGIAYLIMPYYADRVGSVKAITIVQWIAIGALLGIPLSPNFFLVSLMYLIRMVVMNSTWPILSSYSLSQVPSEHRSFTLSATNFSFNVPKGLTPGIAGFIYSFNLELPFFICAAFYTVATIIFYMAFRKRDDKEEPMEPGPCTEEE